MRRSTARGTTARLTAVAVAVLVAGAVPAVPARAADDGALGRTVDVGEVTLGPIPGGNGVVQASAAVSADPAFVPSLADDYREDEFLFRGVANTYSGPATGPPEKASTGNAYVTRLIVRVPQDPSDFSGRVFLEPFNTTSGPDRDALWRPIAPLLQGNGDAWVGVSVRAGSVFQLQEFDAARYADLSIPTNDLVWDMLRQLGAVVRSGGKQSPLRGMRAEHLYLGGYSQSGVDTTTFAMSFHDDTRLRDGAPIFDGYLPAAHAATMTPLQSGSGLITEFDEGRMEPVDVPVVDIETQHDVMGWSREVVPGTFYTSQSGASVRRSDSNSRTDKYRLFEITGASHSSGGGNCGGVPSTFPGPMFVRAAAAQLFRWAEEGTAPTKAARIEMEKVDIVSVPRVDEIGHALGGVRSPFVDVPLVQYQVQAGGTGLSCTFSGVENPIPADVLASRYDDVDAYIDQFTKRLDATIKAGFLLKSDRAEILETATAKAASLLPPGG
jgi:hypothetical protein